MKKRDCSVCKIDFWAAFIGIIFVCFKKNTIFAENKFE